MQMSSSHLRREHHASLSKFMWLHCKKAAYVCWLKIIMKPNKTICLWHKRNTQETSCTVRGDDLLFHCSEAREHFEVVDFCLDASVHKAEDISINSFQEGLCQNHQILLGRGGGYFVYFFKKDVPFSGYHVMFIYFVIAVGEEQVFMTCQKGIYYV